MKERQQRSATLRRVLAYVGKYKGYLWLSLGLSVVTVACNLSLPVLAGRAIDTMIAAGKVDFLRLWPVLLHIGSVVAISAAAQWLMSFSHHRLAFGTVRNIRTEAFAHLQKLPLSMLDRNPTGDIASRVIADVEQFSDGLVLGFSQLFSAVLTILGTLLFMYSVNPIIATAVVVITPLSLGLASLIAKHTYAMFLEQTKARGEQTALVDEVISQQKVVQAFLQEEVLEKRFDAINERLRAFSLKAIFYSSISNPGTRFVNGLVFTCVGVLGAMMAITTGGISVGQLSSFLSYANQYTKPFNEISGVVTELQNALACARRVFELLDEPMETPDAKGAQVLSTVDGSVTLSEVCFSYDPERPLIVGLNLSVKQGQRVAIVGPTGSGKTTLINLLMRFYDVDQGTIRVSGCEVGELTRGSLRKAYGMVLQETWLKTATVRENIAMGREDAGEEEIMAAAKAAHAHGFIKRLPQGYDTILTEGGISLSQGQKQLLCIARVMLCLPPMLILDEATSSIDTRTEEHVQSAFERMMEGRTSFVVAHRLSTIRHAHVILVMHQGQIVEQGTHEELHSQKGFYARLYESQFAL